MSSWDNSYVFGEYSNQSYVSDSVFGPGVERGEEVVSVVRCDDGRVLPDLNQYAYGSYHSHVEQQQMNKYEEGANDFEEVDNDFEQGVGDEEGANDHEEPNPDLSFEIGQV
ncbi:hypothetical protein L1987_04690 [Smallanthus sonchifolius]|uniref:Uncharacterized protein n=1 Tax=Smallanthus sonchifolius TaxID=185202 RepID=A0ACB9JT98_9ASTR|nr:hypothetical protein L1987_04690 [Smallanthus sonchifolius]